MVKQKTSKDPFADREASKYENPIPSREFILEYLAELGRPATYEQVIEDLELDSDESREAMRRRLIAMTRDGQLHRNRKDAYGPLDKMDLIAGRIIGHKDGFGFVVPDTGGEDLFLSPREMRHVFHGDRVLVRVANVDMRGRREGLIIEVLEHNTRQLVGRLHMGQGAAYVEAVNQRLNQDVLIPREELNGAEDGQMVVVAITSQPTKRMHPIGQIIEVLGDHMAPGMEINVAIRNHELPNEWPDDVTMEASRFPAEVPAEALTSDRVDLRALPFVTIDGEDAKDFDDAVYCEVKESGGWKLYVAIADVSYYVRPKMALDREAENRGNSVYFPSRVIPMLPEALSNNLCSLKPDVDRLVMVCEMDIDKKGNISKYDFMQAVIKSHARLTYTQVYEMMEKNDRRMRERFEKIVPHLTNLYDIFKALGNARQARGAIDFDMPETKIVFGKNKKIEKIIPYERFNSHRVIEECMLAANICAAQFIEKHEHPGLFRVHQGPREEKLEDLRRFLQEMGLKMPGDRSPVPADYSKILRATKERPDARMIQTMLLRSMSQAVYSPDNKGHFGLAYEAYAHFTSPIRRYPDLLVHRAIKAILVNKHSPHMDMNAYVKAGEHCSMTERRADDATNEVTDWLKCEFMLDKVGHEFDGTVSGVTNFGVFVELSEVYVEGLIHISALPADYYHFDPVKHELIGERAGVSYRLGDPVKIRVARVDLDQCKIDFVLAGSIDEPGKKAKGGRLAQKNSKDKKDKDKDKKDKDKKKKGGKRKKR